MTERLAVLGRTLRLVGASAAVFGVLVVTPVAAGATTPQQAVAWLNQQRAANGIPGDLVEDSYLDTGCWNHDHYLALNPGAWSTSPHGEDPTLPGATPEGGDYSGIAEVLAYGAVESWSAATNPWQNAPAHADIMADPAYVSSGYAEREGQFCMRLRGWREVPDSNAYYAWTGPAGRVGVPISHRLYDEPFDSSQYGFADGQMVGPDIFVYSQQWGASPLSAAISGPAGPVDLVIAGRNTLVPREPLAPQSSYTATVAWPDSAGDGNTTQTFTFTTGSADNARGDQSGANSGTSLRHVSLKLARTTRGHGRTRKVRLLAGPAAVGRRAMVRVTRRHARRLTLKRGQWITLPSPSKRHPVRVMVTLARFSKAGARYMSTRVSRRYWR